MQLLTKPGALRGGWRWSLLSLIAAPAFVAVACGGGDGEDAFSGPMEVGGTKINPIIVSSEITTGDDRISLGLLDEQDQPIADAQLVFNFYSIVNDNGTRFATVNAFPIKVARSYTDTHTDGTIETHDVGEIGVYVGAVDFVSAGDYGLVVTGKAKGEDIGQIQMRFNVISDGDAPSIGVGERAPRTVQPILSDVATIEVIDTSDPPDPEMHKQTIAAAVSSGKPTVVVFATPSFCTSRICGPVKQTVDEVSKQYGDTVNFIHVEPFDLIKARSGAGLVPLPFLEKEWGLTTEPWTYVVGKDGFVSARFEAAVAPEEIHKAIQTALGATGR